MEMGESLVSAYFKYVEGLRLVVHNAPFHQGQGELDLIAIDPKNRRACFSEVTTHILGMLYTGNDQTVTKVRDKLKRAHAYALSQFPGWQHEFMQWSPVVPKGLALKLLQLEAELRGEGLTVTMIINERFTDRVKVLQAKAATNSSATDEPAFRLLQILGRLR
jgi:Holliday junction resolvase-like predicted endonuclease